MPSGRHAPGPAPGAGRRVHPAPRLTDGDVACWVLKTSTPPAAFSAGWSAGEERVVTRCVRRSYRLGLMAAGQPCLLWLSGRVRPGVHALGRLADDPLDGPDGPAAPVRFTLLAEPVDRVDLVADPAFADAEVLRMPAGSNPSWLTAGQFAAVRARLGRYGLEPWFP